MPASDDYEEFEHFVAARRPALLRTAYLLTGNSHDAEDLVQTALVKVVPAWHRIAGHPEAYVRQVLARESITRHRRRRWREISTDIVPEHAKEHDPTTRHAVRTALMALPPRQRAVIVLRYYEDLTEAQTAQVLGIAVGTVKSQTRHAMDRLRALVPATELISPR